MSLRSFYPDLPPSRSLVDLYRLEPDYEREPLVLPEDKLQRIQGHLHALYGSELASETWQELERLLRVHHCHKSPALSAAEATYDARRRFDQRDVVLITYGDVIRDPDRPPLAVLGQLTEEYFQGLITTLHVLPFYPYSSDRGFSVISYRQVDPRLGSWNDIARLGRSFQLMFDAVFNHVSSQSLWFREFRAGNPWYRDFFIGFSTREEVSEDHRRLILRPRTSELLTEVTTLDGPRFVWTTFSPDQVDLNFKHPRVLLEVLRILLSYVRRGADLIRLDAVTYLWCELGTSCAHLEQTHVCVKLFRDVLDVAAPHVALVTETNVPHVDNISYFGNGYDEAQMVYNFALPPLVLHTFLSGDATRLADWASELDPPSDRTTFFNFLASHDGIGLLGARGILEDSEIDALCEQVTARGGLVSLRTEKDGSESPYELNVTWWSALNPPETTDDEPLQLDRFLASWAVALSLRGVPGIYTPSLFGSRNDLDAVRQSHSKRDINRPVIEERALRALLADGRTRSARIFARFLHLLRQRGSSPAFDPNGLQRVVSTGSRGVFALLRIAADRETRVLCLVNVTSGSQSLQLALDDLELPSELVDLLSGERTRAERGRLTLQLEPYRVLWLESAGS